MTQGECNVDELNMKTAACAECGRDDGFAGCGSCADLCTSAAKIDENARKALIEAMAKIEDVFQILAKRSIPHNTTELEQAQEFLESYANYLCEEDDGL